jgi:hypothetical protein
MFHIVACAIIHSHMLQIVVNIPVGIQTYFETTPFEVMFAHALFAVGWIPIAGVLFWGLTQLWLDARQGLYASKLRWQLLAINVPQDAVQTPKGMENFFTNLAGSKSSITWKEKWLYGKFQVWFSFEIVSNGGQIQYYIRLVEKYRDVVEAALYAQYPEAQITEVEDYTDIIPDDYPNDDIDVWGSEMIAKKPSFFPMRTWTEFEHMGEKDQRFKDPLLPMLEGMGKMLPGENYWLQMLIMQPDDQDWTKKGQKWIFDKYGKEEKKKDASWLHSLAWIPEEIMKQIGGMFAPAGDEKKQQFDWAAFKITPQEKGQIDAVERKISKLGWYAKIRFVYSAKTELYRKGTIASMSKGIFHQYGHLSWNKFGIHGDSTPKDDYFWQTWQIEKKKTILVNKYKNRSFGPGSTPYILNTEELATIFHFPAADARTPVLTSLGARRAEAPQELHFAAANEPDLPNLERVEPDVAGSMPTKGTPVERKPLAVPSLTSPTGLRKSKSSQYPVSSIQKKKQHSIDENMPKAGMPAPLPPGLDISDEPIESTQAPKNLPIDL